MQERLMTKEQLIARYKGKFIKVYQFPYAERDSLGRWITKYECLGCSRTIKENYNPPEEA